MIFVIITLVFFIATLIPSIFLFRSTWGKSFDELDSEEFLNKALSIICLFILTAAMGVEICIICVNHGAMAKKEYEQKLYEKEVLEYRLANNDLIGNELLYRDITDFNNSIREARYLYENPWTNWFNSGLIPSIDYIELDMNNNA